MTDAPIEDPAIALSSGDCSQLDGYDVQTSIQPRGGEVTRGRPGYAYKSRGNLRNDIFSI